MMHNLWSVAAYEYRRNVFKKSFLFTLFSIPFMLAVTVSLGFILEGRQNNNQPIGIVDQADILSAEMIPAEIQSRWVDEVDQPLEFILFDSDRAARSALEAKQIQAYFSLSQDYQQTRNIEVVYIQKPGQNAWRQFYDLLRINLLSDQSPKILYRAADGIDFTVRSVDGLRRVPLNSGPTFGLLMPLFISMAFLFMLLMSSGYTLSAIADEKENRTMEVLVTSVSPQQLMSGKVMGVVAISLTILLAWTGVVILGVFISQQVGVGWFSDLSMDWRSVAAAVAIGLPAYVLATALMIAIGTMVTTVQEGQSVSGLFFVLHFIPLYISLLFLKDPHSSLAILLSILPFTSLITVGMRNLFTIVPTWQVLVSVVIQVISALFAIWLAGRAFRLGMLRYGQRLHLRHLFR